MNPDCKRFNVGDKGQRYEVRYKTHDGGEHVFGWQPEETGGLVDACRLWPRAAEVWVVDRHADSAKPRPDDLRIGHTPETAE